MVPSGLHADQAASAYPLAWLVVGSARCAGSGLDQAGAGWRPLARAWPAGRHAPALTDSRRLLSAALGLRRVTASPLSPRPEGLLWLTATPAGAQARLGVGGCQPS